MLELWLLLLACGAGTYLWRGPAVLISAGINPRSGIFTWISCVAYAIIAGIVSRMVFMPTGTLAETTGFERLACLLAAGLVYFRFTRRNLLAGVLAGAAALMFLRVAGLP